MIPGSAAGSTTVKTARARVAPSASAPSRRVDRDEQQQLLSRPHDERDHHDAECEATGERREVPERQHRDAERKHADHDRWHAVERIGGEASCRREAGSTVFCRVHAAQHANRNREQRTRGR